jgi:hypothetical protein
MKRLFGRPSPAMAVATIALFVSLGGVSYGVATGSIDSREIKNNDVRGKDVRNGTLSAFDLGDSGRPVRKFGPVLIPQGQAATLATYGPFTIVGQCREVGTNTSLRVIIATSEANSAFGGAANQAGEFGPTTPEDDRVLRNTTAGPTAAVHSNPTNDAFSAIAPSGRTFTGTVHGTANGVSNACRAYGGYTRVK